MKRHEPNTDNNVSFDRVRYRTVVCLCQIYVLEPAFNKIVNNTIYYITASAQ